MTESNWTIEKTRRLFELCENAKRDGKSLSCAFRAAAEETGRSVNSVRNYYYSQAKTFELVPELAKKLGIRAAKVKREAFVPFETDEIKKLIESILLAKGSGKSVRAAILEMANGDEKLALRYQNKYRSYLRSHRDEVEEIMTELSARGAEYFDPYKKDRADNFARLTEYIASLDDSRVGKFLSLIEKLTVSD